MVAIALPLLSVTVVGFAARPHAAPLASPAAIAATPKPPVMLEPIDVVFYGTSLGILASAGLLVFRVSQDGLQYDAKPNPGEPDYIARVRQARSAGFRAPALDYYRARDALGISDVSDAAADDDDRTEELGRAFLAVKARSDARSELVTKLESAVTREDYQVAAEIKVQLARLDEQESGPTG
jgi:hypothetical protein|mmetsp:Transcript_16661/g.43777  ORF Transcript_16661/g.43777 Transcript_16661/m.43777 type:complete len:182 (+) Transcript_16661:66-611(+)